MSLGYITVPKHEYQSLLAEVKRATEVCGEMAGLRVVLKALSTRLGQDSEVPGDAVAGDLKRAIEACESVSRLRVELSAFERRLREFDQDLTPVRPPSRTDIKAAFENSVDFATGKKKPPVSSG